MKNVLLIGMNDEHGGVESFIREVQNEFEGEKLHFYILNRYRNKGMSDYDDILNNTSSEIIDCFEGKYRYITRYSCARKFFTKNNFFDIVHVNALTLNSIFWIKAAQKSGIKKVIMHSHIDNIDYSSKIKKWLSTFLYKKNVVYLKNHKEIIKLAASENAGKWMFGNEPFEVVYNGVNVDKFKFDPETRKHIRKDYGLDDNNKVIICVARLTYQKNYDCILNIFKHINSINGSYKLFILGTGVLKDDIVSFIRKNNLEDSVFMIGSKNNVNDYLSAADCMLMPSRFEGLPFSLVEAQSCGLPCLVSKDVIPKEANVTGNLEYLSLNQDIEMWCSELVNMINKLNDEQSRRKMNDIVKHSKFNKTNSMKIISKIYLEDVVKNEIFTQSKTNI